LKCTLYCHRSQFIGTRGPECAFESTADGRTYGRGNNNFFHGSLVSLKAIAVRQVLKHRNTDQNLKPFRVPSSAKNLLLLDAAQKQQIPHGESRSE
jgi:hypothetical protein